ncbi:hypothetical protein THAOC_00561 [Thalassiosira oceanica]|uniref:Sulfotransferase domain-containing protein n=1 Tax=Thalassiosira oceanica TaxID=159749 RepID=K0TP27_THAOC|nr:hypothetical protein THAOC_00561 [Thalassiosira oceanica]|eukprot:EJK77596.1 hypothetical protein THAOC_00561 [Thalassiosira oceanica]
MGGRRKPKASCSSANGLRKPPPAEPPSASDFEDSIPKRQQRRARSGTGRSTVSTFGGKRRADPPADPPDRSRGSFNHTRRAVPSGPTGYHTDNSLLEDEEEMYSQFEEEMYSHQSLVVESESESSHQPISCRQFNLTPIYDVVNEKKENKSSNKIQRARVSKKKDTRQREAPLSYMLSEDEEDVDALLDACDIPANTHEEFYNEDSSTDEDDEERPLRRSVSSNDLRRPRRTRAASVLGSWEIFLNRCLVISFCFVGFIYLREHTPGYKKDHHHHHVLSNTDDDDDAWRRPIDPMAVYNTNDDDSTHTRDHDPTHAYDKYTNRDASKPDSKYSANPQSKYSKESAGERISERPPDKSLHHGFMDAEYEDRPASRNSGSTALEKSSKRAVNEEDKAFLESVIRHPAAPEVKSLSLGTDDVEDKDKTSQMNNKTERPKPNGYAANKTPSSPPDEKSPRYGAVTESDFQFGLDEVAGLPSNDFDDGDSLVEWGGKNELTEMPGEKGSERSDNFHSGANYLSNVNLGQASPATESVKSVYDQAFRRWNHEYIPGQDMPLLWRIPRSASATFESILSFCYGMVLASSMGATEELIQDLALGVLTKGNGMFALSNPSSLLWPERTSCSRLFLCKGARYINVDTSTLKGIERAKQLKLVETDVDVITTPFIYEAAGIFDDSSRTGKCFTLLRHPVDRAISLYHHYQVDTTMTNPNISHYRGMTIDQYSNEVSENNWMGPLSWHDLENAKEVFGRKCLVGLLDEAEVSLKRFERLFHWQERVSDPAIKDQCIHQYLANGDRRKEHPTYEGTQAWETLRKKNEYDVLLFEYAKNLFTQQSAVYDKMS